MTDSDHGNQAPSAPGAPDERTHDPESVPLDVDEGDDVVIDLQDDVPPERGGDEHPDPRTPPQAPAPGS